MLRNFHGSARHFLKNLFLRGMKKYSRLGSIINNRCPRCRTGHLFIHPYSLGTAYKMLDYCPVCSQKYEPEPGYYYGAMFISYVLTGWLFLAIGLTLVFVLGWTLAPTLLVVAMVMLLSHNLIYRLSRSIWIHIFVKFDPQAIPVDTKSSE